MVKCHACIYAASESTLIQGLMARLFNGNKTACNVFLITVGFIHNHIHCSGHILHTAE